MRNQEKYNRLKVADDHSDHKPRLHRSTSEAAKNSKKRRGSERRFYKVLQNQMEVGCSKAE
jgi:hypothetical protein